MMNEVGNGESNFVNFGEIVPDLINYIQQFKGLHAHFLISSDLRKILVETNEFKQIIEPIIEDTYREMPKDGFIYIFADNLPDSEINVEGLDPTRHYIRIIIRKEANYNIQLTGVSKVTKNIIDICQGSCNHISESEKIEDIVIYLPAI